MIYKNALHWFRRDLRIKDNIGLYNCQKKAKFITTIFIYDQNILSLLDNKNDLRVEFLYQSLLDLKSQLREKGISLFTYYGDPKKIIIDFIKKNQIDYLTFNRDYENYPLKRDSDIKKIVSNLGLESESFKDHVIFEGDEIYTANGKPYSVFSPFRNNWIKKLDNKKFNLKNLKYQNNKSYKETNVINPKEFGFNNMNLRKKNILPGSKGAKSELKKFSSIINNYSDNRDFPNLSANSRLSVHLRFGTISIRELVNKCFEVNTISSNKWLNELVWRDFYSSILFNFPYVEKLEFNKKYQNLKWNKNDIFFNAWCNGKTGYPIVDAAITELNLTGFMHNRCRMIVASFLTKHLLCDWRLGEAYFAKKLIDFDLASNNGGWQWAASTGCDSQPYFRVFNPSLQSEKFDKLGKYIKRYLPIFKSVDPKYLHSPWQHSDKLEIYGIKLGKNYPLPIVNHPKARVKAIDFFKRL